MTPYGREEREVSLCLSSPLGKKTRWDGRGGRGAHTRENQPPGRPQPVPCFLFLPPSSFLCEVSG